MTKGLQKLGTQNQLLQLCYGGSINEGMATGSLFSVRQGKDWDGDYSWARPLRQSWLVKALQMVFSWTLQPRDLGWDRLWYQKKVEFLRRKREKTGHFQIQKLSLNTMGAGTWSSWKWCDSHCIWYQEGLSSILGPTGGSAIWVKLF